MLLSRTGSFRPITKSETTSMSAMYRVIVLGDIASGIPAGIKARIVSAAKLFEGLSWMIKVNSSRAAPWWRLRPPR